MVVSPVSGGKKRGSRRRGVRVELSAAGKTIGVLERDGNVWYWEARDEEGAFAAGWEWTENGTLVKRTENETKGRN